MSVVFLVDRSMCQRRQAEQGHAEAQARLGYTARFPRYRPAVLRP